jgi:hypothetical protein
MSASTFRRFKYDPCFAGKVLSGRTGFAEKITHFRKKKALSGLAPETAP